MNALEIKNLNFSYEKNSPILSDISLDVQKGKFISLIGHNGSGKSTLAKLIIGLLKADSGEIFVDGVPLNKKNLRDIRKKICLVFQNPDNQFIASTVEDDIAFGLENRQIPTKEMPPIVLDYAKKVGMEPFLCKEPSSLSGGQKQRVAIAGALALKPDILILDEATSMLDPKGKREILELIQNIRKENKEMTLISITHDIEEAYLSDEVIVLVKGCIAAKGKPDDIFNNRDVIDSLNMSKPFFLSLKESFKDVNITKEDSIEQIAEKIYVNQNK